MSNGKRWAILKALLRCPNEWLDLLWLPAAHVDHNVRHRIPLAPHGVEFKAWLFPEGSRFGNGSGMLPLNEVAEPEFLVEEVPQTTTSLSGTTEVRTFRASERGENQ